MNFDEYAEDYDQILQDQLKLFDEETNYFAEYKVKIVNRIVKVIPDKILEYGCGTGRNIKFLTESFPHSQIYGCDISRKSLELAKRRNISAEFFIIENGEDKFIECFDLILIACVFHHIPQEFWVKNIFTLKSWLKKRGELFIFEHNPYNPVTRHMVNTCPYDKDAVLIRPKKMKYLLINAGFEVISKKYALFFPSFLRKFRFLEKNMGSIPLGGQYYIHAFKP